VIPASARFGLPPRLRTGAIGPQLILARNCILYRIGWLAPIAIVASAVSLIIVFDIQPVGALDDDWGYAYSVQQLITGHGLRWFPTDSAIHLVQTLWAAAMTFGHADPRTLRLTAIPFIVLATIMIWLVSREIGASRFWSGVAAGGLVCTPLAAAVATSFMTDFFYLGLLMTAVYFTLGWATGRFPPWPAAAACVLAACQRQHGVLLAGWVLAVLIVIRWRRGLRAADIIAAAGVVLSDLLILSIPYVAGVATVEMRNRIADFSTPTSSMLMAWSVVGVAPIVLAWFAMPFLGALGPRHIARVRWVLLAAVILAVITVIAVQLSVAAQTRWQVKWSLSGIGPWTMGGAKHIPRGLGKYFQVVAFVLPPALAVFLWHGRPWLFEGGGVRTVLLGLVAITQLVPMVETNPLDRYWLVVAAPMLPVFALHATHAGAGLLGRSAALLIMSGNVAVWALAEQDYLAWQGATIRAAQMAYATIPPTQLAASYEINTVNVVVPYYDRTGRLPHQNIDAQGLDDTINLMEFGPSHPAARLCFASLGDPRPGADYWSSSPGKVVWTRDPC
jgi:hypothetical protein